MSDLAKRAWLAKLEVEAAARDAAEAAAEAGAADAVVTEDAKVVAGERPARESTTDRVLPGKQTSGGDEATDWAEWSGEEVAAASSDWMREIVAAKDTIVQLTESYM